MSDRQSLLRPRTGFELGVLIVSGLSILSILGALIFAALSAPDGPPDLRASVSRTPVRSSGGDAYAVTVSNEGGLSTENVVVEVRIGSTVREVTVRAVARGDVAEATAVFPRGVQGTPEATVVSYGQTG